LLSGEGQDQLIVDEMGNYLIHPDPNLSWSGPNNLNSGWNIKNDLPDVWQLIQKGEQTATLIDSQAENSTSIYAFAPVVIDFNGNGYKYYLVYKEVFDEGFGGIDKLSNTLVEISIIVSLITFIAIYLFISYLVEPIVKLTASVQNPDLIQKPDFIEQKSSLEIEELAKAFVDLVNNLKKSQEEVNRKVESQTEMITKNAQKLESQRAAMINLIEDIDSQRKLTQQQAADLRKFKLAIDTVSELIVIADRGGKIIYVNPAVENLTGYTQKEVIGSKTENFWGKQMPTEWHQHFWTTISEKKQKFEGQITYKKKNGEKSITNINVQPLLDDVGNVQHFISVQRDITKEVQVDRMKTDFISLASHQLRTPLSAMRWFLEMILNGDLGALNKDQRDVIANINESNNRMISLVNALLNISRIESGRIIINPKPTQIVKLTKKVLLSVKERFDKKGQQLLFKADLNLPEISLDQDLIIQVMLNLLTNANKYTPQGGKISVNIFQKGGLVYFQISDSGYGIPEDEQKNIFKRFFRSTNIVKIVTEGTGLGLYLAKAIIDSSGGKIGFISKLNQGSTFWFGIPVVGVKKKAGGVSLTLTPL